MQSGQKKKNLLQSILSLITYKDTGPDRVFAIPEVESQDDSTGQKADASSGSGDAKSASGESKNRPDENRKVKKPVPISRYGMEKEDKKTGADNKTISRDIKSNIDYLHKSFNHPDNKDIVIREFMIADQYKAFIAYLEGMADRVTVNNFILRPLLQIDGFREKTPECKLEYILNSVIEINQAKNIENHSEALFEILVGNTILYIDDCTYYLSCETKGFDKRGVESPQAEGVVKGPQEAFNESLRTNLTLVRKIIKNSNLTTEFLKIGNVSQTLCAIMYLNGIVNPAIVKEVKRRINSIKTDALFSTGMLEQFLESNQWAIVPTVISTERPDRAASHIVEGKVAIFLDGSPYTIIVPTTAHALVHSPEDSALKWQYATSLRFIRLIAIIIAGMLPGLYVALTNFHQEMLPTDLLIAIVEAKENVPFPTIVEVLLMELSFELIREAGIRIPGIIGNTLGIIGALILGQAAVQANIVSPILIIVVAVTGLGNFAIPDYNLGFGIRLLRFGFIAAGAILGFYGIAILLLMFAAYVVDMDCFGVPFYSPLAPRTKRSFDLVIRWPVWMQEKRPDYLNPLQRQRQPEISRQWTQEDPENSYDKGGGRDEGR